MDQLIEIVQQEVAERGVPRKYQDAVVRLETNMMLHDAYGNPDYEWSLNDFELGFRLGRGKFGRVFCAREKKTGFIVALKTLLKRELVEGQMEHQILREIEIQSHLKHPNILQLLTWFHDDFRIYLALEYAGGGELYHHLRSSPYGRFPEHKSAKYVYQVADALDYCHTNNVIHRDLKPENLLVTIDGNIKLSDFGWSVHAPSLRRKTVCGTLDYLPPEMVKKCGYGPFVDNWCLGILCYEFCVGSPPFETSDKAETYKRITSLEMIYPSCIPDGAVDLIKNLLVLQPEKRFTLKNVMAHPWILSFYNPRNNVIYEWSLNDFELGFRLGRGKFGRVFCAREKKTGFIVALKTLLKRELVEGQMEHQILREIESQSHLKHPNILQLFIWFHDDFRIYLALEYAGGGELYHHLKSSPYGRFLEHKSAKYVYQVADALDYCHTNNVIHRDLKPENLLVAIDGNIKLSDFGWSVHAPSLRRKTVCGTLDYLPPEMVKKCGYGPFVDNWCLGILCYEFCVGSPPFETSDKVETYKRITSLEMIYPSCIPDGAVDLIKNLLILQPEKRLTLKNVMAHPWILSFYNPTKNVL